MVSMDVGDFITALRAERGKTQAQCADSAHMATQTWNRQENSQQRAWSISNAKSALSALHAMMPLTASQLSIFGQVWRFDPLQVIRPPNTLETLGRAMLDSIYKDPSRGPRQILAMVQHLLASGVRPGEIFANLVILGGKHGIEPIDPDQIDGALQFFAFTEHDGRHWQVRVIQPAAASTIPASIPPATTRPAASA